jgi:hypothetical protein
MGGSYAWVINYGTGKNVNTPPSTVPIHQHYPFSWIELVDTFTDEFDLERREASRFRGAESDWRAEESTRFNSGARDSSRFHKEAFARRSKDSGRGQSRSEQSTVALQAQQRQCDRGPQHNDNLREGSALLKAIHKTSSTVIIAPTSSQFQAFLPATIPGLFLTRC